MKLRTLAHAVSLICIALPVAAQDAAPEKKDPTKLEKIEVTGSSIKRVQDEGSSPVQVIKAQDLVKLGITSAEQLLANISANGNGIDGLVTNQGSDFLNSTGKKGPNNGASGASLRGLGTEYTLVLLNGRRVATHALNGSSVDLNSIPLAAIDRVEILKDGASAIYGTDAIGGVINFILKRDYKGFEATAFGDVTQHGDGNIFRASLLGGFGDLATDRFNVMTSLTYDTNDRLRGKQRDFHNGYQPNRGLAPDTTGTPYANIGQAGGTALGSRFTLAGSTQTYNRVNLLALQGKCNTISDMSPYRGDITGFNNNNQACAYDYGKQWSLLQPVDRTNLISRGSLAISADHTAFVEVVASRNKSAVEYTPIQITNQNYPAFIKDPSGNNIRSPYYQDLTGLVPGFNNQLAERIRWRCLECGPRQQDTTTDAFRVLAGLEGNLSGWDYKFGLSSSESKATTLLGDGNMIIDKINAALATGLINPFLLPGQSQTQQAMDLINGAKAKGLGLYGGKAAVKQVDGSASKELFTLPAGPLAAAFGFDIRKEEYRFKEDQSNQPAISGVTAPSSLNKVDREIKAVYGELQIPVVKNLDLQLAVRYDKYSDVGSTTNPKVAAKWQPVPQVGFRSSYSTGFHAPDFNSLYGGDSTGQFNSDINDPINCPTGKEATGCGIRPTIIGKSNTNLKPEKSKQWSVGVLVQPAPWFSASVDLWQIELTDRIGAISGQLLISRYDQYARFVIRDADGEIDSIVSPTFNLGGDKTRGADINLNGNWKTDVGQFAATLEGTYTSSFKSRFSDADPYAELVGKFGDTTNGFNLHVRWKHAANITWSQGPWSTTLSQNYTGGYQAERDGFGSGFTAAGSPDRIKSYTLYNLTGTYTGIKNLSITAGIKNLFDTKPSFSNHNVDNVAGAGWDGRVGDPRLRSFTLRLNYKFL
jgi:iron complex outermembrane recepter protein